MSPAASTVLAPGLVLFQSRLALPEQRDLWATCRALAEGPVPMYTPTVRGGRKMSVGMRSGCIPIVSVSLGDAARFVFGGLSRRDPTHPLILRSGDVLVMGGPSRLRFHGVTRILTGTAPEGTGPGRFNLTFRQW